MARTTAVPALLSALAALSLCACTRPSEPARQPEPTADPAAAPQAATPEPEPTTAPAAEASGSTTLPGDLCAQAVPMVFAPEGTASTLTGSLAGYTSQTQESEIAAIGGSVGAEQYFAIDAEAGDRLFVSVDDSHEWDSAVYVTRDCNDPVANVVGGGDAGVGVAAASVTFQQGGRHYLALSAIGSPGASTRYTMTVRRLSAAQQAAAELMNVGADACADAPVLQIPSWVTGDLAPATDTTGGAEAGGFQWIGKDHFFALDLAAGQSVHLGLNDRGAFDAGLYVFRSCDDIPGTVEATWDTEDNDRTNHFLATAAGRYYVAVDVHTDTTSGGPYRLSVVP